MAADARWAVVAALAPLAMYYVAWDAVLNYSNTVLLLPACTATFYCRLRLQRDPRLRWYCAFGLALGIGVMSKDNYLIVAAAFTSSTSIASTRPKPPHDAAAADRAWRARCRGASPWASDCSPQRPVARLVPNTCSRPITIQV